MTATERSFLIKRALLRALADCQGYAATESAVREACSIKIDFLRPTTAEIDAQLRTIDAERLAVSRPSERGTKYTITDNGQLWLDANA